MDRPTVSTRLRQLAPIVLVGLAVLLLLRVGYDLSLSRAPETENAPNSTEPNDAVSTTPPSPTRSAEGLTRWTIASGPPVGDTQWSLAVTTVAGLYCAELSTSRGPTVRSCGHDGHELQVLRSPAGADRTFVFGPVSRKVERVWIEMQDGRVVNGIAYTVSRKVGAPFGLYLLVVRSISTGEILAVDKQGLVVGSAHYSAGFPSIPGSGRLDGYGNIIGYVRPYRGPTPPPGRPARLGAIRYFLGASLANVKPEIRQWWSDRPRPESDPAIIREWWSAYPLTRWIPHEEATTP